MGNKQIIDSLNLEKFGARNGAIPTGYSSVKDYYYITNLEQPGSTEGTKLGGFHWPGKPGGVQVKFIVSNYNESAEEGTAHELGHWLGLPHAFKKLKGTGQIENINPPFIPIIEYEGETNNNFMDYNVQRKKWLKIQLLNYIRN